MCVHAHARGRCCLCMYVCTSILNLVSAHGGWRGRRLSSLSFFNFTDSCWSWNLLFSASPSGQQDSGLHLSQPSKPWVCKYVLHTQFFKAGAADLNTGLCAWETSPSLTEPSPFPFLGISIDSSSHRCGSPIVCWNLTDYASTVVLVNVFIGDIWSLVGLYLPVDRPETTLLKFERNPLPSKVLETSIRSLFTFCSFLPRDTVPSRS